MNPMITTEQTRALISEQSKLVKARYDQRVEARTRKLKEVQQNGVLKAAGVDAAVGRAAHLTVAEGRTLEAIIGGNDLAPKNFLDRGVNAAIPVCRLTQDGAPIGTGFLVGPGLLITNNHVIASRQEAASFIAEFNFEMEVDEDSKTPNRFRLAPESLFVTSSSEKLDFTIVAVASTGERGEPLKSFGWLPLEPRSNKILEGEPVIIIQHPQGRMKEVCLFHSELVDRIDEGIPVLHYTTDSEPGSSGSPAFNRSWQVVGLHHASAATGRTVRGRAEIVNEAIRISAIVNALKTGQDIASESGNGASPDHLKAFQLLSDPATLGDGRPQVPTAPGPRPADEAVSRPELERTTIRTDSASRFSGRKGYDEAFLGNAFKVPFPRLPAFMTSETARLVNDPTSSLLKYTHFSCIVSALRRLPIVTACNIDGATSVSLPRTDRGRGAATRPESLTPLGLDLEAADAWFFDGRIADAAQLGPKVYDGTAFDFGHMVRREDPVWGDASTARTANDDTFHMTNCAPQHHDLNTKTWLALENGVLNSARQGKIRISVFTGPVLSTQDPEVLGVSVPTGFWKIAAWVEGGRLKARGFMQWQKKLIQDIQQELEALTPLDRVEEYHVPIADIARDTALDFGPLLAADDPPQGGRRRINESLAENPLDLEFDMGLPSRGTMPPESRSGAARSSRPAEEIHTSA